MRTILIMIVAAIVGYGVAQLGDYLNAPASQGGGSAGVAGGSGGTTGPNIDPFIAGPGGSAK